MCIDCICVLTYLCVSSGVPLNGSSWYKLYYSLQSRTCGYVFSWSLEIQVAVAV